MSGDSKKRQDLQRQINDVLNRKVKDGVKLDWLERLKSFITSPKNWDLVEKTIAIPENQVETQRFILCFEFLNEEECDYGMQQGQVRALVALFKQVSLMLVSELPASRIIRDSVQNTGEYASLFRRLTPDVTSLYETEIGNGRIFYFVVGNKFNIVSIEANHRNTDR